MERGLGGHWTPFCPGELRVVSLAGPPWLPLEEGEVVRGPEEAGCEEALVSASAWVEGSEVGAFMQKYNRLQGPKISKVSDPESPVGYRGKAGAPSHFPEGVMGTGWGRCFWGLRPCLSPYACHPGLPPPPHRAPQKALPLPAACLWYSLCPAH